MNNTPHVKDILLKENITSWYQPIVKPQSNKVLGWEALTRGPSVSALHSAPALFKAAQEANILKPLELMCIKNALKSFEQLQLSGKLFVNISHELFLAGNHLRKQLKELVANGPINPNKVVLELTEQSSTTDTEKLSEAINFFHDLGFQIAIDDLGIGEISHQQWMALKPDYVKVARQYINGIDHDEEKQNLVKSIVSAARATHAKVIAIGVETEAELTTLYKLGITNCQGYLFQRPQLSPIAPDLSCYSLLEENETILACDLVSNQNRLSPDATISSAMGLFQHDQTMDTLAIEKDGKIYSLLKKSRLEQLIAAGEISVDQNILEAPKVLEKNYTQVDAYAKLPELVRELVNRSREKAYDDFVVTSQGDFLGLGSLLDAVKHLSQSIR